MHAIAPVVGRECRARNLDVLVVIYRKILPVARTRAQRRHTQHVGDELKSLAVPREDHRARAGKPVRFRNG